MATTDRPAAEPTDDASDVAAAIGDAELVQLVCRADGDALCAAGILAAGCLSRGTPYHVVAAHTAAEVAARLAAADDSATPVVVGADHGDAMALVPDGPASALAARVAADLGNPMPATALAGVVAAGGVPSRAAPDLLEAAALERAPGVALVTDDVADGLAHTTLVHAALSGDVDAARDAVADLGLADARLADLDEAEARRLASLVALAAGGASDATARAATAVERALRPYRTDGPFATLGGHADVLGALAERAPGLAVALTVGDDGREAALDAWRANGRAAHAAVREAETARHRGVVVARTDGPLTTVARLLRDYRSPEPTVLCVADGRAAAASVEGPVGPALEAAAEATQGSSLASGTAGEATFDADRTDDFVAAFRAAAS